MEKENLRGSCLCGAVSFESSEAPLSFKYCTCKSCQKTTGSAHAANLTVPVEALTWISGESLIRKFVQEKENPGFPTWFCSRCGSFLPHVSRSGSVFVIPAGSLDSQVVLKPDEVIYWEECPSWFVSTASLPRVNGEG